MDFENLECEEIDDHPSTFLDPSTGYESGMVHPFPADQACYAIAVCNGVADLLEDDRERRGAMVTSITNSWKGHEADRYQEVVAPHIHNLQTDAIEALRELAGAISEAWHESDLHNQQMVNDHPGVT